MNKSLVELHRLLRMKGVIQPGAHEKRRRGVGGDLVHVHPRPAGVDHHVEIRPAALLVDRVLRVRLSVVEVRFDPRALLAAGGETHHADAVRVDVPFLGVGANDPHALLRVGQGINSRAVGAQTIAFDERRGPLIVEPLGDVDSFAADVAGGVSSAGDDGVAYPLALSAGPRKSTWIDG